MTYREEMERAIKTSMDVEESQFLSSSMEYFDRWKCDPEAAEKAGREADIHLAKYYANKYLYDYSQRIRSE